MIQRNKEWDKGDDHNDDCFVDKPWGGGVSMLDGPESWRNGLLEIDTETHDIYDMNYKYPIAMLNEPKVI